MVGENEKNPNIDPMGNDNPFGSEAPQSPRAACQLGILVLDGSGSMNDPDKNGNPKHQSVNSAVKETLSRLQTSAKKNAIDLAIIKFGMEAELIADVTPVVNLDPMQDYDPLIGGNTYVKKGLKIAAEVAEKYLKNPPVAGLPTTVVIIVLTDGGFSEDPNEVVAYIKQNNSITINACFFGKEANDNAINALKSICTDPVNGYLTVYNTEQIRKFFIASISKIKN